MKMCKNCQKPLTKQRNKFCSRLCYSKFKTKPRIISICKNCSKNFEVKKYRLKTGRGKFCSQKCFYSQNDKLIECRNCHKEFKVKKAKHNQIFCSYKCSYKYIWKDGKGTCTICGEIKPQEKFHESTKSKSGFTLQCKPCAKKRFKNTNLKRVYGISLSCFNKMKSKQNGKCLICKRETKLVVDHCHSTGEIRGLLCNKCNVGLGCFGENITFLKSAIRYLNRQ